MTLSADQARRFYDRIGRRQDSQGWYEDPATAELLAHGRFAEARAVFELGCGTGRFAARLLAEHLPEGALYRGTDLSPVMVDLAQKCLAPFGGRAEVRLVAGGPPSGEPAGAYDRFVSNYVFDLLSQEEIRAVLREAERMLEPGGLLCVASLSTGSNLASRCVARLWTAVYRWRPALVGGCRPLELRPYLAEDSWRVLHLARVAPWGVPSEAVVAERRPPVRAARTDSREGGSS